MQGIRTHAVIKNPQRAAFSTLQIQPAQQVKLWDPALEESHTASVPVFEPLFIESSPPIKWAIGDDTVAEVAAYRAGRCGV